MGEGFLPAERRGLLGGQVMGTGLEGGERLGLIHTRATTGRDTAASPGARANPAPRPGSPHSQDGINIACALEVEDTSIGIRHRQQDGARHRPSTPPKWAGGKAGRGVGGTRQETQDWKRRRSHLGHSPLTATTHALYNTTQPGKGVWKGVWVTTPTVGKREGYEGMNSCKTKTTVSIGMLNPRTKRTKTPMTPVEKTPAAYLRCSTFST